MSTSLPQLPSDATLDRWSKELGTRSRKRDRKRRSFRVAMLYARYCRDVACRLPSAKAEKSAALQQRKLRRGARIRRSLLHRAAGLE